MPYNTTTANGLKLLYTGEFENDPAANTVNDLALFFNYNMEYLDTLTGRIEDLEPKMQKVDNAGLLNRFIYGGSF